jgi:hypothetical protein
VFRLSDMEQIRCKICGEKHSGRICSSFESVDKRSSRHPVTVKNAGSNPVTLANAREAEADKHPVVDRKEAGSTPATSANAGVAQRIEQTPSKGHGEGSNPSASSTSFDRNKYQREYMRDKAIIKRLGLNMTVKEWREKNDQRGV